MTRVLVVLFAGLVAARADGPTDNLAENVRRQPPPGVAIPDDVRKSLTDETARLGAAIDVVRGELAAKKSPALTYLPDVQIFHKAVDWALRYDEFYDVRQTEWAAQQLKDGFSRLEVLRGGGLQPPSAHGDSKAPPPPSPSIAALAHGNGSAEVANLRYTLVPRGYVSKIDGSVQPFGVVLPPSFNANLPYRWRLDCWFHGRGEKLTELDFIHQRQTQPGEFTPPDTIVLHPYGRYCNGHRFAGETDFFEALETVKRHYRIDDDRIVVRGFSLGGAACWHLATHHAWQWCAANPGAGFSETEQFLNFFQGEKLQPHPWERKLWNLYDATAVAGNLFNCPTVAYSGENDRQKQAADLMAAALKKEGAELTHIIGPRTAHSIEKGAKANISHRVDALASRGRYPHVPAVWQTASLKYNRFAFGQIDSLDESWTMARLVISRASSDGEDFLSVRTSNINALRLSLSVAEVQSLYGANKVLLIYEAKGGGSFGQRLDLVPQSDGSYQQSFRVVDTDTGKHWATGTLQADGLRKKHGLQGPIDDAFMDSFLFVRPTGSAASEKAGAWAKAEMERAIEHWRRHFRGDARVKDDAAITDDDIKSANLVLWGDPSSNALMAKIASKLPITWSGTEIKTGAKSFPAADHALICIYPNPLHPERYVVLNSSFTFREYDYLNNARQTPKLPDWAVINLNTPPTSRYPGAIPAADFFDEAWQLKGP